MARPHIRLPNLTPQDIQRFWSKVDKTPGQGPKGDCWEWQAGRFNNGYGQFKVRRPFVSHRISYFLTTNDDPESLVICHTCDNHACCKPSHLFKGTQQDNMDDAKRKGRTATGDRNASRLYPWIHQQKPSKLTLADRVAIVEEYLAGGITHKLLAQKYQVTRVRIGQIIRAAKKNLIQQSLLLSEQP